jgi:hypothetical protein
MRKSKKRSKSAMKGIFRRRTTVFSRFPLLFTLLGTFGVVATFYGFQHILEDIPLLADYPYIALIVGLLILFVTGKLYKKLD